MDEHGDSHSQSYSSTSPPPGSDLENLLLDLLFFDGADSWLADNSGIICVPQTSYCFTIITEWETVVINNSPIRTSIGSNYPNTSLTYLSREYGVIFEAQNKKLHISSYDVIYDSP